MVSNRIDDIFEGRWRPQNFHFVYTIEISVSLYKCQIDVDT